MYIEDSSLGSLLTLQRSVDAPRVHLIIVKQLCADAVRHQCRQAKPDVGTKDEQPLTLTPRIATYTRIYEVRRAARLAVLL